MWHPWLLWSWVQEVRGGEVFILTAVARSGPLPPLWSASTATHPVRKITDRPPITPGARHPAATREALFLNPLSSKGCPWE